MSFYFIMRNIQTLISALKKIKASSCIIENPEFKKTIDLYRGNDYKQLTTIIKNTNRSEMTLFSNNNWSLQLSLHDKFKPKMYDKGYAKIMNGSISPDKNSENLNYNRFLDNNSTFYIYKPWILNNHSAEIAHVITLSKVKN